MAFETLFCLQPLEQAPVLLLCLLWHSNLAYSFQKTAFRTQQCQSVDCTKVQEMASGR